MRCKKAERFLSLALDGRLRPKQSAALIRHLENCQECRRKKEEYQTMRSCMQSQEFPAPSSYFINRLKSRLTPFYKPEIIWKRWALRAVPVSLLTIALLAVVIALAPPAAGPELSQSEILLHHQNPFEETWPLMEEELGSESANMRILFTAWSEYPGLRRPFP
jgi:predicted anti-sigma-YlaC factor YlaD